MKIDLRELEDGQTEFTWEETAEELEIESSDVVFDGPIRTRATVTKLGEALSARGRSEFRIAVNCAGCDEPIELSFGADFAFVFQKGRPRGLEGDEDETLIWLDEAPQEIDLGVEVRDYILLEIPMSPVCKDYESGSCPNLSAIEDAEKRARREGEIDPRWAALNSLKEK